MGDLSVVLYCIVYFFVILCIAFENIQILVCSFFPHIHKSFLIVKQFKRRMHGIVIAECLEG